MQSIISQVAGIDLIPSIDFEIANVNISISKGDEQVTIPIKSDDPLGDGLSAVAWHYDSFPFVCVVMLSDCANMVGGETAIRTPTGEVMKVRGPDMVRKSHLTHAYPTFLTVYSTGNRRRAPGPLH